MSQTDDALEYTNCNLCGCDDYAVVYEADLDSRNYGDLEAAFRSSGDETLVDQVVKCNHCGLIYVNPRLKPDVVLEAYAQGSDEAFVAQNKGRELTFGKCLDKVERYHEKGDGERLLDIGTAGGAFLHVAQRRGWEVSGCEPNRWLCDWCLENYGIQIQSGSLFDQNYTAGSFDVVSLWDVLEHTPDPRKVIGETHRLLDAGGHLVINYPDIGSMVAKLMGRKWVFLLSVHLFYYTRSTIVRLLESEGFDVEGIHPHYQSLPLGYIFQRAGAYVGGIAHLGRKVAQVTRMADLLVPYWMGQTLVVARKREGTSER
jgi:SAM-dependent methyltransferase